jgi:hypothetical protein
MAPAEKLVTINDERFQQVLSGKADCNRKRFNIA